LNEAKIEVFEVMNDFSLAMALHAKPDRRFKSVGFAILVMLCYPLSELRSYNKNKAKTIGQLLVNMW
jgi:hypothetical protein